MARRLILLPHLPHADQPGDAEHTTGGKRLLGGTSKEQASGLFRDFPFQMVRFVAVPFRFAGTGHRPQDG
jgi:hypothetical protein